MPPIVCKSVFKSNMSVSSGKFLGIIILKFALASIVWTVTIVLFLDAARDIFFLKIFHFDDDVCES